MKILGISAFYHDSAACLLEGGKIVAASQEERFTRRKQDLNYPAKAIESCLNIGSLRSENLDAVVFYEKPLLKFERLLESYLAHAPRGLPSFLKAMPLWLRKKLWLKDLIARELDYEGEILFPEHHESHAASAFYPSPFERSAFLTVDGVGEWTTASFGRGEGSEIEILAELKFPHSLGLLYSAFTYYTGFRVNSGEYKVMGLAPYGEPRYADLILDELIDLKEDGSFRMNMSCFGYGAGLTMTNKRFADLFGGPPRSPESALEQRHMDLARSIQDVSETIMLRMAHHVHEETGEANLCLAGGVALNCVANGRILREGPFDDIWIQPAAGDAGGALGAALFAWHQLYGGERKVTGRDSQQASRLGPKFSKESIEDFLLKRDLPYERLGLDETPDRIADLIADGKVVGFFEGRMEFGPRALGGRSILGDARSNEMQTTMNLKIKYRESFRPFAPSALEDEAKNWFELDRASPYMLLVAGVHPKVRCETGNETEQGLDKLKLRRSTIPAVTHVDSSARIQTVSREDHPLYYDVIAAFNRKHGCPVIINTSFNVRGEPIVCTPEDAYLCFMRTEMDHLYLDGFLLDKADQPALQDDEDWRNLYELD
jgi:carbamoyltransferase